ncbi:hypothetical protein NUM3379_00560 [Kineococcus sp. NUM-3379]
MGSWLSQFVLSSGFGGAGAVLAAVIAALVARSAGRQRARETARDQWWDRVTWVAERAAAEQETRLDPLVAVHMLARLAGSPLAQADDWRLLAALNEDVARRARATPTATSLEGHGDVAEASRALAADLERRITAATR